MKEAVGRIELVFSWPRQNFAVIINHYGLTTSSYISDGRWVILITRASEEITSSQLIAEYKLFYFFVANKTNFAITTVANLSSLSHFDHVKQIC